MTTCLVILVLAGCAVLNRTYVPPALEDADIHRLAAADNALRETLEITTWNVGYAGMGAESDFVFDLGEQRRPLSGDLVDANLSAITQHLSELDSDVILLQEAAKPSWLTYRRDVLGGIVTTLKDYAWFFAAEVNLRYVPPPFNVQVGNAIFTRVTPAKAEWRGLPLEPTFELGLFRKGYRMHILRIDDDRQWVIVNVHLSTFDTVEDDVRRKQVTALLAFVQSEYAKGHHVIVGGDWNLRLQQTSFPSTTEEKFKFWIRDFPKELLPKGWMWATDPKTPTVRTAQKPYTAGENYTLIIDGFLVSPNVVIESVDTADLGFRHSDHHPVTAKFRARK